MSAVEIKICGITRAEDALAVIESGASMLGLNFYPPSPRFISLSQAQQITRAIASHRSRVQLVGVFVNINVSDVQAIARALPLDAVQLHGDETPEECDALAAEFAVIRALKVDADFSAASAARFAGCRALLLDTPTPAHGGSGESFPWESVAWKSLRRAMPSAKLFLAGGLHPGNVARAIAAADPDAVDVCSGVESAKGIKSLEKMREFVAAVRAVERQEQ
jgi:phosphoribosylanthranilate isomerase